MVSCKKHKRLVGQGIFSMMSCWDLQSLERSARHRDDLLHQLAQNAREGDLIKAPQGRLWASVMCCYNCRTTSVFRYFVLLYACLGCFAPRGDYNDGWWLGDGLRSITELSRLALVQPISCLLMSFSVTNRYPMTHHSGSGVAAVNPVDANKVHGHWVCFAVITPNFLVSSI